MTQNKNMNNQRNIDRYYLQNVFGVSWVEFFWGLGMPVVVESTFLQLFLKNMGASSLAIGMIPAFFFIGTSVFALLASYYASRLTAKRRAVIGLHFLSSFSLFVFGVIFYILGEIPHILLIFFINYAIFAACIGMMFPVWMNYLVRIFSDHKSVPGLAVMMIAQNSGKLISSLFIVKLVDRYSFSSESSAIIFTCVGVLFFTGSLFFFFTRERPFQYKTIASDDNSFMKYITVSIRQIVGNRNYITFLVADLETVIVVAIISFYANYATTYCGIDPALASGIFVACIYIGSICTNLFLGSFGFFSLKNKYIASKIAAASAMVLLIFAQTPPAFYIASFLLGASRGSRMIVFAPAVSKLAGENDSTSYFAVAPILSLPFATGLPMLYGKFLDQYAYLAADSYRLIFGVSLVLLMVTGGFMMKTDL